MKKPTDYKQYDSRWSSVTYAVDGESSTIKSAGCGPTAMADVLSTLTSKYIDPLTCASWARMKGYKVYKSGTSYSFPEAIGKAYGVKVTRMNYNNAYGHPGMLVHQEALIELRKGNWLIACMGKGLWTSSGHYVVAYGYADGMVYINDPASAKSSRAKNTFAYFSSQVKYYWTVDVPEIIKDGNDYTLAEFIRETQMCLKAGIDGNAGPQTLGRTVTVSAKKNKKHNVVLPLQKYLAKMEFYHGELDGMAGPKMDAAIREFQSKVSGLRNPDGELTAGGRSWRKILGM